MPSKWSLAFAVLLLVGFGCAEGLTLGDRDGSTSLPDVGSNDADGSSDGPQASCDDGMRNGDESGIDCGGHCDPCPPGQGCAVEADCSSRVCSDGVCQAPSCSDGKQNGLETDLDCGGGCPGCGSGGRCIIATDCAMGTCTAGFCGSDQTCDDGFQNQDETDVDCGGVCAPAKRCEHRQKCAVNNDCITNLCDGGTCAMPCTPVAGCTCGSREGINYLFCALSRQWSAAATDCTVRGMRLVRIDSAQENDWVRSNATAASVGAAWIGANDQEVEGSFAWPDGDVFWRNGSTLPGFYANWAANEPNDFFGQDCGVMLTNGQWDDESCSSSRHYVCKAY